MARPFGGGQALRRDGWAWLFLGTSFSARLLDTIRVALGGRRSDRDDRPSERAHNRL